MNTPEYPRILDVEINPKPKRGESEQDADERALHEALKKTYGGTDWTLVGDTVPAVGNVRMTPSELADFKESLIAPVADVMGAHRAMEGDRNLGIDGGSIEDYMHAQQAGRPE